jgi:hypothetical protein
MCCDVLFIDSECRSKSINHQHAELSAKQLKQAHSGISKIESDKQTNEKIEGNKDRQPSENQPIPQPPLITLLS